MIERHVTFQVYPEKTADFIGFFIKTYRPAMASMPGFIKAELLCEQEDPTRYQMVIRFETAEAASHWRNSELHRSLQPGLKTLYKESQLLVYTVVA